MHTQDCASAYAVAFVLNHNKSFDHMTANQQFAFKAEGRSKLSGQ